MLRLDTDALIRRLKMMFSLGRVQLTDDTGPVQLHQVDMGPRNGAGPLSVHDKVPHVKEFGFASVPPLDADVFVAFLTGDRSSGVVLGSNHQPSRLKNLQPGDAALYDVRKAYVWLTPTGVVIDAAGQNVTIQNCAQATIVASTSVTLQTPTVHCTQDLQVDGKVTATGDISSAGTVSAQTAVKVNSVTLTVP